MSKWEHYLNALERANEGFVFLERTSNENYLVYNSDTDHIYEVEQDNNEVYACSCPHSFYRECCCKHMVFIANEFGHDIDYLLKQHIY